MWGRFSLREEENIGVYLTTPEIDPLVSRERNCLMGKLVVNHIIPKEYFKAPLTRVWRPSGGLSFKVIGENLFIAEFKHEWDKSIILEGRPWIFDGFLVSLAEFDGLTLPAKINFDRASFWIGMYNLPLACMGKSTGEKIGSSVGSVEEVDVSDEEAGWGEYLRVKVSIDLSKPLARGRMLHVNDRSSWIAFKYEKLPKFCYSCGIINHGLLGCSQHEAGSKKGGWIEEGGIRASPIWLMAPGEFSATKRSKAGRSFWQKSQRKRNMGESPVKGAE
jgi:hypothetical protein